jgi:hypothetical protein
MKPVMVFLPLDDRPVNYDYPCYLARIAGYDLQMPPREWLGNPWRPSKHSQLVDWLVHAAEGADLLVVSLDTLAYGGLIPSRTSREPVEDVLKRLECLKDLKSRQPKLPIYASSVVLRISRANSAEEEKDYWATYGSQMFRLSYLEHKIDLGVATTEEKDEKDNLDKEIPQDVYDDYLAGRKRNHRVNLTMIEWLEQGTFDYLLLPQDDTAEYGWNIAEARLLQSTLRLKNLTEKAITYPGADEIGSLLLASVACRQAGFKPKVFPRYSSIRSASVTTAYEDRPIHELIKAHLAPLGGCIVSDVHDADFLLYVNAPAQGQGDASLQYIISNEQTDLPPQSHQRHPDGVKLNLVFQNTQREMQTPERSPEEFLQSLLVDLERRVPVALADVAFANGADLQLGNLLMQHKESIYLAAYSGWNTAGNTLGTTLAHAVLRILSKKCGEDPDQLRAHYEFLFLRYLDDNFYQALERTKCMTYDLPALGLKETMELLPAERVGVVEERLSQRLLQSAQQLEKLFIDAGVVKSVRVSNIHLPWQRLFEVGFDVHVELV